MERRNGSRGTVDLSSSSRSVVAGQNYANCKRQGTSTLIHEIFEAQASKTPEAIALIYGPRRVTYREVNDRADFIAERIVKDGIGPEKVAAIVLDRGIDMIIGILAILKAGGAYLPLDPNYPAERIKYILDDAQPHLILTRASLVENLVPLGAALDLGSELRAFGRTRPEILPCQERNLSDESLLYVIYTSGSTGRPKGIEMSHRAMANLLEWHFEIFGEGNGVKVIQLAPTGFDVSFQEIFSTLCTGGSLVLVDELSRRDTDSLLKIIADELVERLFVTPLMLQMLAETCLKSAINPHTLRDIAAAGEQLRVSPQIAKLFETMGKCRLHNHYGPTESHVVVSHTLQNDVRPWAPLPPIGKPILNAEIYVLDEQMKPVPINGTGEIYIGGIGVARGYRRRPELTSARFVADPFRRTERMYKTGDVGRWRDDGVLEYLGRNDHQVKIRGYRIECGEIEAQIGNHPHVSDAVVVARGEESEEKFLVAYFCPRGEHRPTVRTLHNHIRAILPEYMIPRAYVMLEKLPMTPNGKIDRQSLPAPGPEAFLSAKYESPVGDAEKAVAQVWAELLKVDKVGRRDNFFELGGHSLLIGRMVERVRQLGMSVEPRQVFECSTLSALSATSRPLEESCRDESLSEIPLESGVITPDMLPLVALSTGDIKTIVDSVPGGSANVQDIYPLVALQEGMLFHRLMGNGGNDLYGRSILVSLPSRQGTDAFIAALEELVNRHDCLRTAILWESLPRPVQVVYRRALVSVENISLSPDRDPIAELKSAMMPNRGTIDLSTAPILKLQVSANTCDDRCYVLIHTHHIIIDDVSLQILFSEIGLRVKGIELEDATPYREHVVRALRSAENAGAIAYFKEKLADIAEPTAPFGVEAPIEGIERLGRQTVDLETGLLRGVRDVAAKMGVSAAIVFHAAWALTVSYTSGRDDVVFGSVLSGRSQGYGVSGGALGLLINTLPVRVKIDRATAVTLIDQVRLELAALLSHEHASLPLAQRCSGVDPGRPLFSAVLNYVRRGQEFPWGEPSDADVRVIFGPGGTNYPCLLTVYDEVERVVLEASVDVRNSPSTLIEYFYTALTSLVQALNHTPNFPALSLEVLPKNTKDECVRLFNQTGYPFPHEKLLHELIEEQVLQGPDTVAVNDGQSSLSYEELNHRSNRLAGYLAGRGVGPDKLVAVYARRSVDMLVGMLATLKAGGAYVPMDPSNPPGRLSHVLRDSDPVVILTQKTLWNTLPDSDKPRFFLDEACDINGCLTGEDVDARRLGLRPSNLAYVIYTSGSTGTPKGVAVTHRNVVNYATYAIRKFDVPRGNGSLVCTSLAFDLGLTGLYPTLLSGRTVTLCREEHGIPLLVGGVQQCSDLAPLKITPSHLYMLRDALIANTLSGRVRTLVLGGEPLQAAAVQIWQQSSPQTRIFNHYGPTETTIGCVVHEIESAVSGRVPIGRPIANTQIYILDCSMRPQPVGTVGEIYVGGAGVSRGYLNRSELTAERFVADPYGTGDGARLYKTGDMGLWRSDGTIECLGRNDDQIKIRGFRIEIGEIEATLLASGKVRETVVLAQEQTSEQKKLVAYVVLRDDKVGEGIKETIDRLREELSKSLPDYMIPSDIVPIPRIPLTSNGKLDRKALPVSDRGELTNSRHEEPIGEIERTLAKIWQALLGISRVGRNDNFFRLGGHSLLVTRVSSRIRGVFGIEVPIKTLFEAPTIELLAAQISSDITVPACEREGPRGRNQRVGGRMLIEMSESEMLAEIEELERRIGGAGTGM